MYLEFDTYARAYCRFRGNGNCVEHEKNQKRDNGKWSADFLFFVLK